MFFKNLLLSFILLKFSFYLIFSFKILIYIFSTVLVFIRFFTKSALCLFKFLESNKSLIILVVGPIRIFQHNAMFNKMSLPNINFLIKVLLIVLLMFKFVFVFFILRCIIFANYVTVVIQGAYFKG